MEESEIHQVFLRAVIECANQGATAKELADYLEKAAKGMRVNSAFNLRGDDLRAAIQPETQGI